MWNRFKSAKTVLFVEWTSPTCRYVVVNTGSESPTIISANSLEIAPNACPAETIQEHLAAANISCRHAVVLLPRSDMDISELSFPPATDAEISQLVSNAISLELEDNSTERTTDFLVTARSEQNTNVLAFSLETSVIDELTERFAALQMNLLAITFGGLGASQLLTQLVPVPNATSLVISISDYDINFSVLLEKHPVLFRSFPTTDSPPPVQADRLTAEIRRTLAVAHIPVEDSVAIYIVGDMSEQKRLAQLLSKSLEADVSIINPLETVVLQADIDKSSRYAHLIGMATTYQTKQFPVDLLHPHQAPRSNSRWRPVVFAATAFLLIVCLTGYLSLTRQWQAEHAVSEKREQLNQLIRRANKVLTIHDSVLAVQQWRQDDITWLTELQRLSTNLPGPDRALITKVTMTSDTQGNGLIDLAVQVSTPEVITELETAIRAQQHSVTSKRVSGGNETQMLPWTFDTRIVLKAAVTPLTAPRPSDSPAMKTNVTEGLKDE